MVRAVIITGGSPELKDSQEPPSFNERKMPMSVPTYSVFGLFGSISSVLVGMFGRFPLMSVHVAPEYSSD